MSPLLRRFPVLAILFVPLVSGLGCSGGNDGTPSPGSDGVVGVFLVGLSSDFDPPVASIGGVVKDAPPNSLVIWEQAGKDGSCELQKPRVPFCSTPCGSGNQCVEDDTCKPEAVGKDVGSVTISGVKKATEAGTDVTLTSSAPGTYGTATSLAYPPFDEGADVSFAVASGPYGAFSAHTKGIAPLVVPTGKVAVEKGKPVQLTWTAKGASGDSTIHVHMDISHHGGTKGQIECDAPDTGSLTIGASLVTELVNLGVSGFPTVRLTRRSVGSTKISLGTLQMSTEHNVEREVTIPGHVSCTEDEQCPTGQTCQTDLQCK